MMRSRGIVPGLSVDLMWWFLGLEVPTDSQAQSSDTGATDKLLS